MLLKWREKTGETEEMWFVEEVPVKRRYLIKRCIKMGSTFFQCPCVISL